MAASLHALLLLSDSALPLGSFAFSSGLESFLAHQKILQTQPTHSLSSKLSTFDSFLSHSLTNISSTSLPYVLTAYNSPSQLPDLDNAYDASTPCTVARRASISQGRALLQIWERALAAAASGSGSGTKDSVEQVSALGSRLKLNVVDEFGLSVSGHFAPLFGAVCAAMGLSEHETSYLFLLNHAKAVLSAAVRASVMGPYQSQAVLAGAGLQECITRCVVQEAGRDVKDAAVTVPTMDLWMGRHELLYSRIFNS